LRVPIPSGTRWIPSISPYEISESSTDETEGTTATTADEPTATCELSAPESPTTEKTEGTTAEAVCKNKSLERSATPPSLSDQPFDWRTIPGILESREKRAAQRKQSAERKMARQEIRSASVNAKRASVRRIHRAAKNEDTFSEWLRAVKPGRSTHALYKREARIIEWWESRSICPFCRSEDVNRTIKRPFRLPSGHVEYVSGFWCFRCEQMYIGPEIHEKFF